MIYPSDMSIFSDLEEKNCTYAVVVSHNTVIGVDGFNTKDYFILAFGSRDILRELGFRLNERRIMYRTMSKWEVGVFKSFASDMRLVMTCNEGKVYEQPEKSFKSIYDDLQKKAVKHTREGICFEERPFSLSKVQQKLAERLRQPKVRP